MQNINAGLGDWVSFEKLAEEYPTFPVRTLRYLSRAEVRKENGFDHCVRLVTARKFVVSLSRFAAWIEGLPVDGETVGIPRSAGLNTGRGTK